MPQVLLLSLYALSVFYAVYDALPQALDTTVLLSQTQPKRADSCGYCSSNCPSEKPTALLSTKDPLPLPRAVTCLAALLTCVMNAFLSSSRHAVDTAHSSRHVTEALTHADTRLPQLHTTMQSTGLTQSLKMLLRAKCNKLLKILFYGTFKLFCPPISICYCLETVFMW